MLVIPREAHQPHPYSNAQQATRNRYNDSRFTTSFGIVKTFAASVSRQFLEGSSDPSTSL